MDALNGIKLLASFQVARRNLDNSTSLSNLTQDEFLVLRRIRLESEESESHKIMMFKAVKISNYLSMPAPAISRILNFLENRQLIVRTIDTNNRRSIIISLTDAGKTILEQAEKEINLFASELSSELGEENTTLLIELLNKVSTYCEKRKKLPNE